MYKLLAIILLGLSLSISTTAGASAPHGAAGTNGAASASDDTNKNLAMIGGGLLGMLLASGAVGLISTGTMVLEGTAIADAIEAGAGLPMSLAVLSAILGALFTQDAVLEQINAFQKHRANTATH
jgi:hypothetical protein